MSGWAKLAGLVVATLLGVQLLVQGTRSKGGVAVGAPAPALALPDLDGHTFDLQKLKGRVVAVNFWATWCGPCQFELPTLAETWLKNHDRCFEILGVAEESGNDADLKLAGQKLGIPYPILNDVGGTLADRFKVPGYPRTYLIDTEGKIRRIYDGALRPGELERAIGPLLPKAPQSCPRA